MAFGATLCLFGSHALLRASIHWLEGGSDESLESFVIAGLWL